MKDGGKHTHPHTSSTPITQRDPSHLKVTRELPKALNELPTQTADTRPPTKGQQSGHTDELKNECLMQIAKAIMNSNSTSETEAGLPGGNFKSGFSLYSTDTEEQVTKLEQWF